MSIPKPRDVTQLGPITTALDAASHAERVDWCRSLGGPELYALFDLAAGQAPVSVDDMVKGDGVVVPHIGKNGVPVFTLFQKHFSRLGDEVVGFNDNHETGPGLIRPLFRRLTGPGHYVAYDSPEVPGEVWIDYRRIPQRQHPRFPALTDNSRGIRSLVFGNMVDIVRRVSEHVTIGDGTKKMPSPVRLSLGCRIGRLFPTAPFILCREP